MPQMPFPRLSARQHIGGPRRGIGFGEWGSRSALKRQDMQRIERDHSHIASHRELGRMTEWANGAQVSKCQSCTSMFHIAIRLVNSSRSIYKIPRAVGRPLSVIRQRRPFNVDHRPTVG
uniref:Uncharacterized protein n=1 Tax=Eutreptiella gymnastica TaxID=73025 RepID=A0A7S4G3J4_9EUGL